MAQARTVIHKEVATLNHHIEAVWGIISGFGGIKTWMPAIESCLLEGDGIGAVRTVSFKGTSIKERLEIYDPKTHIISYRLLDPTGFPMRGGFGTISLKAIGDGMTELTWISDAEEVDAEGIATIEPVLGPFMRENISTIQSHLDRPAKG